MLIPVLLFIVGLLFLIKGGDWFVDGASALARRFHLPELLIGATVVSIGTTLPEVMVSTMSGAVRPRRDRLRQRHRLGHLQRGPDRGHHHCRAARQGGPQDPASAGGLLLCGGGHLLRGGLRLGQASPVRMGFIMLAMFVAYMAANVLQMKNAPRSEHESSPRKRQCPSPRSLMLLVLGAVLIAVGANLLVDNGTLIAQALGVPESRSSR